MTTSVKFLHSGMAGAPSLSGTAGALAALLDACLVDGFGQRTVDSLVIASNVATMTISAGHGAEVGAVVLVSGATVSGGSVNGLQRATVTDSTHVSFPTTGLSDQTATGTILMRLAPLGWEIQHTATNLRVYRSLDSASLDHVLHLDDSGTTDARVRGFESITSTTVGDGTGPFPTSAQISGGGYWWKSRTADAVTKAWMLVGDERAFVLFIAHDAGAQTTFSSYFFGDILPEWSSDTYAALLTCAASSGTAVAGTTQSNQGLGYSDPTTANGVAFMPRGYSGVGSAQSMRKMFPTLASSGAVAVSGYNSATGVPYPNGPNQGLYLNNVCLLDPSVNFRGRLPGIYACPQTIAAATFANRDSVGSVAFLTGRLVKAAIVPAGANFGAIFFDCTGPWR